MGICKFCDQNKKLIGAHILPWAFFKSLYPPDDDSPLLMLRAKGQKLNVRPKGASDQNILCEECDHRFGEYDGYAKKIFLDETPKPYPTAPENAVTIEGTDRQIIQLFFLSVVWRASISTLSELRGIDLGPFENQAKNILKTKRFPTGHPFEMILIKYDPGRFPEIALKNILLPTTGKIDGIRMVKVHLPSAYQCIVKVDSRPFTATLQKVTVTALDPICILKPGKFENSPAFKALGELARSAEESPKTNSLTHGRQENKISSVDRGQISRRAHSF